MAEYDAIDQVVNQILPVIVNRVKELKGSVAQAHQRNDELMNLLADVRDDLSGRVELAQATAEAGVNVEHVETILRALTEDFMEEMNDRLVQMENKIAELVEAQAPKKTVRRRRKNAATTEEVAKPTPVPVTGNDILHANYALCAAKGNIGEARMCEPSVSREAFEYIASLTAEEILDIVGKSPVDDETIPYKYVQSNWADVK